MAMDDQKAIVSAVPTPSDAPSTAKKLNGRMKAFADYYLGSARFNGTKAAIMAGYSAKTAYSIANENLKKPDIRNYIDERLSELTLASNEVLARLSDIATGSIEDVLDENGNFDYKAAKKRGTLPLIKKIKRKTTTELLTKSEEDGDVQNLVHEEVEFEMYSSHEALRDLGKYHKLFTDKVESVNTHVGRVVVEFEEDGE